MDKMHRPEVQPKKYIPVEIPKFGETVTVQGSKFILRDDDGSSIFEGEILVERASGTGHSTVIMPRDMAEEMLTCLTKTGITADSMKSIIVNKLTADEEEIIRGDVRKFIESVNSARPQDRQAHYDAWQYYLRGLYSTQRELAISECDKIVAELIKSGKYYMNAETLIDIDEDVRVFAETLMGDTSNADEENVRNRARTHADNIYSSTTDDEKEERREYWVIYLCSLPESRREIARLAYEERKEALTGEADQADNDGNYCDPSVQTSSIYTPFTGVEVDALLNQSRQERGVRGRFINEELKEDVDGDQEAEA